LAFERQECTRAACPIRPGATGQPLSVYRGIPNTQEVPVGDKSPRDAEKKKKKAAAQKAQKSAAAAPRPDIVVKPAKPAR